MIDLLSPDFSRHPAASRPAYHYAPRSSEQPPVISILSVLHARNGGISSTLTTVLRQSWQAFEWLLADCGGSPDELEAARALAAADPRVRLIPAKVATPEAAKNQLASEAQGEQLLFLEPGDMLEATALEKWHWFLEAQPHFAAVSSAAVFLEERPRIEETQFPDVPHFPQVGVAHETFLIRSSAFASAGGYRATSGPECPHTDFWSRFSAAGLFAGSLPEHLKWCSAQEGRTVRFRPRSTTGQCWPWYPGRHLAKSRKRREEPFELAPLLPAERPCRNPLAKSTSRLLIFVPFLIAGGSEKAVLDILEQLTSRGWEVTVVATADCPPVWLAEFARFTPDVFVLPSFVNSQHIPTHWPAFTRYLMESRDFDVVLISNCEFAFHLLPYLRFHFPKVVYAAVRHAENWPRLTQDQCCLLDLNLMSFEQIRRGLVAKGCDDRNMDVYHTNVDTSVWRRDEKARSQVRLRLGISESLPVIVYTARLVDSKQPQVFAETVRRLQQRGLKFAALAIGVGPYLGWLRDFVKVHRLKGVLHVMGAVHSSQIPQLVGSADIFFLPTQVWKESR